MINVSQSFQSITPCFCAGAEQNQAEIRPASIRGQLRWWFRVLGGSPEMEKSIFGGVHNGTVASKVIVRVTDCKPVFANSKMLPRGNNSPGYYLFHFAKAGNKDIRYGDKAWLAPGTTFTVQCLERQKLEEQEKNSLEKAWRAFALLGALGLRATRACGAFQTNGLTWQELQDKLQEFSAALKFWHVATPQGKPDFCQDWLSCISKLEGVLGHLRQNGYSAGENGNNPTALGNSCPRQASALHLRPILLQEGLLPLLFFTPQILERQHDLALDGLVFNPCYSQANREDHSNRTHHLHKTLGC